MALTSATGIKLSQVFGTSGKFMPSASVTQLKTWGRCFWATRNGYLPVIARPIVFFWTSFGQALWLDTAPYYKCRPQPYYLVAQKTKAVIPWDDGTKTETTKFLNNFLGISARCCPKTHLPTDTSVISSFWAVIQ